jgi:hypothetical protein
MVSRTIQRIRAATYAFVARLFPRIDFDPEAQRKAATAEATYNVFALIGAFLRALLHR